MSDHLTALDDARHERDEAQLAERAALTSRAQLAEDRAQLAEDRLWRWGSIALLVGLVGGAALQPLLSMLLGSP